ncbi:MAG TPA: FecR family protein [Chitinophagaceae bacterium]|nr:FecR family protein [Chitinophagaceae bacterium]
MDQSENQFWSLLSKKLSQEAAPEELQELHFILLNNPELHHQADMLTEMWKQQLNNKNTVTNESTYVRHIMKHKDDFFTDEIPEDVNSAEVIIEERPGFFRKRRITLFAVLVFLMLGAASFYFLGQKTESGTVAGKSISSVATKNGNRTNIVLPDGSQVWLNAGSTLDYNNADFNKQIREVSLNGEAYFDVTQNAEKPFIIHTKKMDIKVIGTAFNVRSYNDDKIAEASLIRGTIEVSLKDRKDQKIILKPNEKISVVNEETKQEIKPEKVNLVKSNAVPIPQFVVKEIKPNPTYNIIGEIAWVQNKLYFEDETFEDIGHLMERWYGKKVTIANETLKSVHYTGNFENETMEEVLSYMKLSRPFNFRIGNDNVVIY